MDVQPGSRGVRARAAGDELDVLRRRVATPAQTLAFLTGVVFAGIGLAGLCAPAGPAQHASLIQLLFAVAGLLMAGEQHGARRFLIRGGALYLALTSTGLALEPLAAYAPINSADFFHFVLAGAMIVAGVVTRPGRKPRSRTARILES